MNDNLGMITVENKIELIVAKQILKRSSDRKKRIISESLENRKFTYLEHITPMKKQLYNFINKCMNFSADSEDVFQEALLKGFKYFDSYDHSKNFNAWLFTIASNLVKDHFRKKKVHLPLEQNFICDKKNPAVSSQVTDVYQAVGKLNSLHRQVFYLFYYNEFKITEISEITGLTQSNVKFILTQSRKTIKKILEVPE